MGDRRRPLLEMTRARLLEQFREPAVLFWVFVFPVLLAVGLGIAFRDRPPEPARVGLDQAHPGAAQLQALLEADDQVQPVPLSAQELPLALKKTSVDLVAELTPGEPPAISYRYDPMNPGSRLARLAADQAIQRGLGRSEPALTSDDARPEPGGRYIDFLIPGLIGINLMSTSLWGIGYDLAQSRKRRLLRAYAVTPMRRWHFLAAIGLARLCFLVLEVGALVLFGALVFDVFVEGSALLLALVCTAGAFCFAGLAVLCASRTANAEVAAGLMNALMLPMWLLSGVFFSYERFPEAFHPVIKALPLTALNDALRTVYSGTGGVADIGAELLVILAWGVGSFVVAVRIFRWQ